MKTLFISILTFLFFCKEYAQAQLNVSTLPETKNVLIEEYSGPICASCPSGHKKGKQIKSLNPENVFEMRVIDEGFSFSSFDLSLAIGDTLEKNAKLVAFPQATINRKKIISDTMAIYVRDWEKETNIALTESAYVNVAAKGTLNMTTRELSVEVKAYFTGNGTSNNKINIALLQSHIKGMQFGKDDNHSNILPNGEYEHNHILRHLITGQWGEQIATTTSGTLYHQTFTYTLPTDIEYIPLVMSDIEILVFIAEGKNEIINVTEANIDFILPNNIQPIDIELTSSNHETSTCEGFIEPSVTIKNNGINSINEYKITYYINRDIYTIDSIGTEVFTTSISPGTSYEANFPQIPVSHSVNLMGYDIEILDSGVMDLNSGDNWFTEKVYLLETLSTPSYSQDFDDYDAYWSINHGIVRDEFPLIVGVNKYRTGTTYEMGAYGNSIKSIYFDFFNSPEGTESSIQFDRIDFSNGLLFGLTYSYAYARKNNASEDRFQIEVTTDCGETWDTVFSESGVSLTTTSDLHEDVFIPELNEWQTTSVNLSNYAGFDEVSIKLSGISDHGNLFYMDDLTFGPDASIGLDDFENNKLLVYPNPSTDFIQVELDKTENYTIRIHNTLGQTLINSEVSGKQFSLDISKLKTGVYTLNIQSKSEEFTTKFVKE